MRNIFKFRLAGIFVIPVMVAVFGAAVMLLWNALCPSVFGLPALNYWQAAGILLLARILFGGVGGKHFDHDHGKALGDPRLSHRGNNLREKWMNMSEDERKEFVEKEKEFFKFNKRYSHFHDFFHEGDERGCCGGKAPTEEGDKQP